MTQNNTMSYLFNFVQPIGIMEALYPAELLK